MEPEDIVFRIEVGEGPEGAVVTPHGELDLATQGELRDVLGEHAARGGMTLDLSGLRFMDTSGLRLVLETAEAARRDGFRFAVLPGPRVRAAPVRGRRGDRSRAVPPRRGQRRDLIVMPGEGEATRRLNLLMAARRAGGPRRAVERRRHPRARPHGARCRRLLRALGGHRPAAAVRCARRVRGGRARARGRHRGRRAARRAAPRRRPRGRRPLPARGRRHPLRRDRAAAGARAHHRLDHPRRRAVRPLASAPRTCASSACSPGGSG